MNNKLNKLNKYLEEHENFDRINEGTMGERWAMSDGDWFQDLLAIVEEFNINNSTNFEPYEAIDQYLALI